MLTHLWPDFFRSSIQKNLMNPLWFGLQLLNILFAVSMSLLADEKVSMT